MFQSLLNLKKFLSLEIKRNFDNKAVLGGLDKILSNWLIDAQQDQVDENVLDRIVAYIKEYEAATIEERSQLVDKIITLITPEPDDLNSATDAKNGLPITVQVNDTEKNQVSTPGEPDYTSILDSPVTKINGVGVSMAKKLSLLGIETINDLLHYFPRRYDDFSNLQTINRLEFGVESTIIGTVKSIGTRPTRNPRVSITEAVLTDGTGYIRLSWFNQKYLEKVIQPETQIVVSGKVEQYLGRLTINNPEWEALEKEQLHTNRIVPVYPLVAEVKQRTLRNIIYKTVSFWSPRLDDYLPEWIIREAGLIHQPNAIAQIHFPDSLEQLQQARTRIAFNEIFLLQLGALQQKKMWQKGKASPFSVSDQWMQDQEKKLPYALTRAQKRAIADIRSDLASTTPMNRLLQGDVGAGKTIVAGLATAITLSGHAQVAILAPTSILAEQHFRTFLSLFNSTDGESSLGMLEPGSIQLLVGATPQKERKEILEGLQSGTIKIIIGTHALLEESVQFSNLELAIIDEQHRFGVRQRAVLRSKSENLHLLVMTATPIPRSLALTIYGDLELSIIDEMPPGRQVGDTHVLHPIERERAYSLINNQIQSGYQAFIIYPLVEETETSEQKAAVNEYERLKTEIFPNARIGLVHGRMNQDEKDATMEAFRGREYDILVATTVIEVGVDIPNATIMLIESANRFGLAQLHQLRGRVGRGKEKSYCLLIPETDDAAENERLIAMCSTNDGFILAEKDLEQRGPGEFLGVRQSGYSNFKIASLSNIKLIEQARHFANKLFEIDPFFEKSEHQALQKLIHYHWQYGQGDIS